MLYPTANIGAALLRISMGSLFLAHVGIRLLFITMPVAVSYFVSIGLPGPLAYAVTATEALVGVALILGWQVRVMAAAGAAVLAGAAIFAHFQNGFLFTNTNGGWEYPVFWCAALIAQGLLGAGAWSLDEKLGAGPR